MSFVDSPSGALRANRPEGPTVCREDLNHLHTARVEDFFQSFRSLEILQVLSTNGRSFGPIRVQRAGVSIGKRLPRDLQRASRERSS